MRFTRVEIEKTRKFLQGMYGNEGRRIFDDEVKEYLRVVSNLKK